MELTLDDFKNTEEEKSANETKLMRIPSFFINHETVFYDDQKQLLS